MDFHYSKLIDALDLLMISLSKQRMLGLDPEVNEALKKITHIRRAYKKAFNLRLLTQKQLNAKLKA